MAAKRELIKTGTDKPLLLTRHRAGSDQLPLTHEFLSMMLAVRRAGVTVATGTLQQAGFIRIAGEISRLSMLKASKRSPANATASSGTRKRLCWAENRS